ncbi:two-component system OmpR family sensor kinase [Microbacterium sp. W4I4]|uniref:sensor histidine kinase n=1 Tax=Microbacterium sp. W4I4 TaxID=3042295 RepID=UPI00278481B0|nr:ATP-binding protein [Microbacterium sp. W4I4]MDQ0615854.1 two-component system OmpR family sensor kinase [Microbacterium sp. W4I4]
MFARPVSLQARLMAAVIGFVSLILVVVAIITSATLGNSLEQRLRDQLSSYSAGIKGWVTDTEALTSIRGTELTADRVLTGRRVPLGLLLAVQPPNQSASGVTVSSDGLQSLSAGDLFELTQALRSDGSAVVSLHSGGSYLVTISQTENGTIVVTGLSRAEIQGTLGDLFTVIALATLGGLLLLAITTALTISMGLRPLRAVAATATRVAGQPLDRGEVSITERVPEYEADPRTEVGRVGIALNTLLDHVDTSLAARQRNEERMRRFVADASHELRTPLASIRGYSELSLRALSQNQGPDTVADTTSALERIQAQSLRMTRLVEDLLLLARLDEGQELVRGSVDLTQLAVEALSDAQPTALDHDWELDVPEQPVLLSGDAGRLHQVLANLLANARTHTPAGTTITLSLAVEAQSAVLRVHDDGPGIDPDVREELFARFARGDVSRARQSGGTGLGLAIAKAIVEGHGGSVDVTSAPGDTTFTVRLPVAPAAPPSAPQPPTAPVPTPAQ